MQAKSATVTARIANMLTPRLSTITAILVAPIMGVATTNPMPARITPKLDRFTTDDALSEAESMFLALN